MRKKVQNLDTVLRVLPSRNQNVGLRYAQDECDMNGSCTVAPLGVTAAVNSVALLIMSSPTACQPDINQNEGEVK